MTSGGCWGASSPASRHLAHAADYILQLFGRPLAALAIQTFDLRGEESTEQAIRSHLERRHVFFLRGVGVERNHRFIIELVERVRGIAAKQPDAGRLAVLSGEPDAVAVCIDHESWRQRSIL